MRAVTVGVNPEYEALAKLAARCVRENTGLDTTILNTDHFNLSGLNHPAALRLKLFEYVSDENILYFDADWMCVRPWNPRLYSNQLAVFACRDFVLKDDWPNQHIDEGVQSDSNILQKYNPQTIRYDYVEDICSFTSVEIDCRNWFNSGLLIINRSHHKKWFKRSLELYLGAIGHHVEYYEQPAMLKSFELEKMRMEYLPRRYNVLVATRQKWPEFVIGLHIKIKRHRRFLEKVIAGEITNVSQVREYFVG